VLTCAHCSPFPANIKLSKILGNKKKSKVDEKLRNIDSYKIVTALDKKSASSHISLGLLYSFPITHF
jgi:hypothetical protein